MILRWGENFRQKAHFVACGHITDTPTTLTYASVVLRDFIHIALTIAALNGIGILSCDIQNAYLTTEYQENIWTRAGPEFGSKDITFMIVNMALYGLKSGGASFRVHLAETLNDIGFLSTKAEPDLWYRPVVKPNSFEYYEYILCYFDYVLCISHDLDILIGWIQAVFKFKGDNVEQPKIYLGYQVGKMIVD